MNSKNVYLHNQDQHYFLPNFNHHIQNRESIKSALSLFDGSNEQLDNHDIEHMIFLSSN